MITTRITKRLEGAVGYTCKEFEDLVGGRMPYMDDGSDVVCIVQADLNDAEPAFKETQLYSDLVDVFTRHPEFDAVDLRFGKIIKGVGGGW